MGGSIFLLLEGSLHINIYIWGGGCKLSVTAQKLYSNSYCSVKHSAVYNCNLCFTSFSLQDKEGSQEADDCSHTKQNENLDNSDSDTNSNSTVKEAKRLVAVLKVTNYIGFA